ncbi:IFN-alpha/beta-receptor-like secreted glycoprotein, partial [Monkeypox virus]
DMAALG